jgi:AcrR family transcriptional regulator
MNEKDKRYARTEKLIREAFFKSVEINGFVRTGVSGICDAAGISRHAFYAHYDDKYQLLDRLFDELENDLMSTMDTEVLDRAKTGDFYPSAQRLVSDLTRNKDIIAYLIKCDRVRLRAIFNRIYMDHPTSLYVKDYYRKIEEKDIRLYRAYLSSALIGFIEEVLSMEGEMDQEELLDVFYNLIDYISGYYIKQLQKKR